MTLYRQLVVLILVLFILMFVGVLAVKVNGTRTFLTDQLDSHAQDTATSLGLSLSPIMAENDLPTVDTMINAVFDSHRTGGPVSFPLTTRENALGLL